MEMETDASTYNSALVERIAGDLEAAQRWLRTGYENLKRAGDTSYLSTRAAELARVLCDLKRFDEADQYVKISRAATAPDDLANLMG